jgi:crossover junction endodeoxyribonuclease RuvC
MAALLRRFALMGEPLAVLEQAQAMPGQGVTSTFSTGYGFGIWSGILGTLEIPYRAVRPSVWTRKVLEGASGQGKARAVAFASRMFPQAELVPEGCRKPKDGRADALALAYWGSLNP